MDASSAPVEVRGESRQGYGEGEQMSGRRRAMLSGQVSSSSGGGICMCWNIARRTKRSASVKLLGRGSAVTSSCMVFELRGRNLSCSNRCRVEGVSVVIEWWWHFKALEFARGMRDLLLSSCLAGVVL